MYSYSRRKPVLGSRECEKRRFNSAVLIERVYMCYTSGFLVAINAAKDPHEGYGQLFLGTNVSSIKA